MSTVIDKKRVPVRMAQIPSDPQAGPRMVRVKAVAGARNGTRQAGGQRRIVTPGTVVLFGLMIFFGLYSTGRLPEFDTWCDSVVKSAHDNNDAIVAAIEGNWQYLAAVALFAFVAIVVLLIINGRRRKANAAHEYIVE